MEEIHLLRDLLQPNDWLGKIDLKRRLFCSSNLEKISEISAVCLEGISDGIYLPTVWPSVSSPSLYQINETCDCSSAEVGH